MSLSDAEGALLGAAKTKLLAMGFTEAQIQIENVFFEPPGNDKWASLFFIPAQPGVNTLGGQGLDRVTGLFQIDLNYPQGSGTSAARAAADSLREEFIAGRYYTKNGTSVEIISCGPSPGSNVDSYYRRITTIRFRTNFNRAAIT